MADEEKCPCCSNHCDRNDLKCGRGRDHYNGIERIEPTTIHDEVIDYLRKCGHLLHHNKDLKNLDFLSALTEEELNDLCHLLSKICK